MSIKKILVIDDSPTERHVLVEILNKGGYDIITAESGEEGIEKARAEQPDLILMDVVMPGCNGFEATRRLGASPSTAKIPVVFLSSKDQIVDRQWGLRQGAKAYLTKPVQETDLLQTMQRVLARLPQKTP